MLTIPLKELIISQKGKKPQRVAENEFEGSIPYLDIETLESGRTIRFSDIYSTTLSSDSDLLIVADGSRSGLIFKGRKGAVGSTILCLTPVKINRDFLYYFIKSQYLFLASNKTGDSIPHLNTELFFSLEVPFPHPDEQTLIVANLERSWTQFEHEFNSISRNISEKLLSELKIFSTNEIEKLADEQLSIKSFKNSLLSHVLMENVLFPKAKFRHGVKLVDVIDNISYGTAKPMNTELIGTPILRIPNLGESSIDMSNLKYADLSESEYAKLKLEQDDILVIRSNGSIKLLGRSCLVTEKEAGLGFAGYLIRLRVKKNKISAKYLNYCLHSPAVRSQIESIDRSSSGVNNINTTELLNIEINLPDLDSQIEISDRIELLFKSIDKAEINNQDFKNNFDYLQNSILTKAFSALSDNSDATQRDKSLAEIKALKVSLEKRLKESKKEQLLKANEMFMSSKDQTKIIEHIKTFTIKEFGHKKEALSDAEISKIKDNAINSFKDFDYDDFSNLFLELTQDKINHNDPDPFFETKKQDGKIVIKIRQL